MQTTDTTVRDFYAAKGGARLAASETYPRSIKRYLVEEERLFSRILSSGEYECVLEVGCMYGRLMPSVARMGIDYRGVDLVADFITQGRHRASQLGLSDRGAIFWQRSITDIDGIIAENNGAFPREGKKTLAVFPFNSIGNMADPMAALSSLRKHNFDVLVCTYLTDTHASCLRNKYYESCGYSDISLNVDAKGALFCSAEGLHSFAYHAHYLNSLLVRSGFEMTNIHLVKPFGVMYFARAKQVECVAKTVDARLKSVLRAKKDLQRDVAVQTRYDRTSYIEKLKASGRVPGGRMSKDWLRAGGLWDEALDLPGTPALELIAGQIKGFGWKLVSKGEDGGDVTALAATKKRFVLYTGYPTIKGQRPSLADLVIWSKAKDEEKPFTFDVCEAHGIEFEPLCELGETGRDFVRLLLDLKCVVPDREVVEAIACWLKLGIDGRELTIFSGVCPDYTTATDAAGHERYTFDRLDDGVGIVARRAQRAIPVFSKFFDDHHIKVRFIVGIGDFEGDSESILSHVGLTRTQFRANVLRSQRAFMKGLSPNIRERVTARFVTTLFGRNRWDVCLEKAAAEVEAGHMTGALEFTQKDLKDTLSARRSLYERWYGKGADILTALKGQVPQYMAIGALAERLLNNALILGSDAPAMAPFFQGLGDRIRPVLSLHDMGY